MFQSIISILTVLTVAVHATLGCCVHHVHGCEGHDHGSAAQEQATAEHEHHHGHCHHTHHHTDDACVDHDIAGHSPCDENHPCDDGDCGFRSITPTGPSKSLVIASAPLCWSLSTAETGMGALQIDGSTARPDDCCGPHLRPAALRAQCQIWRL